MSQKDRQTRGRSGERYFAKSIAGTGADIIAVFITLLEHNLTATVIGGACHHVLNLNKIVM